MEHESYHVYIQLALCFHTEIISLVRGEYTQCVLANPKRGKVNSRSRFESLIGLSMGHKARLITKPTRRKNMTATAISTIYKTHDF
jgi:hypothetical protein